MSVPTWRRKDNELNLFVEAQLFSVHVLKITQNKNIFLEEFQTSITDRINELAIDIYTNLWKTNHHKLGSAERKSYQKLALDNIVDFLAIWDLAIKAFHLKHNKSEYVIEKILLIRETAKKWIKNDANRLIESGNIENEAA